MPSNQAAEGGRYTVCAVQRGPFARIVNRLAQPFYTSELRNDLTALLARAEQVTGIEDHAPEQVTAPLARMQADLDANPLSPLGNLIAQTALSGSLQSRLRLQKIGPGTPTRPIVLVGWYRSGSSTLQRLLASIPGYGGVPLHRLIQPVHQPGSRMRVGIAARLATAISPELRTLHPVHSGGPEECWPLLSTHLVVDSWSNHWSLPRYGAWLNDVDRLQVYRTWARATAHLEAELGHRLVLKDPNHARSLPELLATVPEARVVMTRRDPVETVASYASLCAIHARTMRGAADPKLVGMRVLERLISDTERTAAGQAHVPAHQIVDVDYRQLVEDPVATVRQICTALDLPFDAALVGAQAIAERATHRRQHTDLAQWGLTSDRIRAELRERGLPEVA